MNPMAIDHVLSLKFYCLPQGSSHHFWCLNHEVLLVEMLERGCISSPDALCEIEPRGKSGMQAHLLASRNS